MQAILSTGYSAIVHKKAKISWVLNISSDLFARIYFLVKTLLSLLHCAICMSNGHKERKEGVYM